ncbi:hypothetical protein Q7I59_23110, partial [Escherichia coli]
TAPREERKVSTCAIALSKSASGSAEEAPENCAVGFAVDNSTTTLLSIAFAAVLSSSAVETVVA